MTPDELYKAILGGITRVRDVRNERGRRHSDVDCVSSIHGNVVADDDLLDEMARNAAQVLTGLIDKDL